MDLKGKDLEEWFVSRGKKCHRNFPHNEDYISRYKNLTDQFNKRIHPFVMQGAAYSDGVFLNDHGPEHIKTVIRRVSELINTEKCLLSEYEVYILLMSIHIHDMGNILGRNNHEINSQVILQDYSQHAGQDRIEWDCIFEIAEAHGGEPKDKISDLIDEKILQKTVRKKLLASLLKFADELSDDRTRANRFLLTTKEQSLQSSLLPEESQLFHMFSYCLHTVDIDLQGKRILLKFDVEEKYLTKTFKKRKKTKKKTYFEQYLINEIYERTYKTHLERIYCSRFFREHVNLETLVVDIEITLEQIDARRKNVKNHIHYVLGETGYPQSKYKDFFKMLPELTDYTGEKIKEQINLNSLTDVSTGD